jgi:monofunctional biosynthetic peptidoglycan transglycosylase
VDDRTNDRDGEPLDEKREGKPARPAEEPREPASGERDGESAPAIESDPTTWLPRASGGGAAAVSGLRSPPPEAPPSDPIEPVQQSAADDLPSGEPSLVEIPVDAPAMPIDARDDEPAREEPATPLPELPPSPAPDATETLAPPLAVEGEPATAESGPPAPPVDDIADASLPPSDLGHQPPVAESAEAPDEPQPTITQPSEPEPVENAAEAVAPRAEPPPSDVRSEPDAAPAAAPAEPVIAPARVEPSTPSRQAAASTSSEDPAMVRPGPAVTLPAPPVIARRHVWLAARAIGTLLLGLAGLVLALIVLYRWVDPPLSSLMLGQRLLGEEITQRWVPLERISPNLRLATIMSEDGRFCRHRGVDWSELREAIESARDGDEPRGGSTISMQVVKNLFLWPSRSYLRKAIEIPLTYVVEAVWPKRRILEIYLNIAEWGPGVFGAEAASRFHFGKRASQLTPREAALLAVSLPNPFARRAGAPGPGTSRLAHNLLVRMRTGRANAFCVRGRPPASRG